MTKTAKTRSWPVRVNGLLLVLQAAGLGRIGAYNVWWVDWQQVQDDLLTSFEETGSIEAAEQAIVVALILALPAILAVLAALGFFLLLRVGWLLAMFVQALTLLACLLLYVEWEEVLYEEPIFIYRVMLYSIIIVLYLNSSDVRAVFHVWRRTETRDG